MKNIIVIIFLTAVCTTVKAQDYNAMAKKIKLLTEADAEFINVKKGFSNTMKSPLGKEVQVALGLVKFDKAQVFTFSPGLSKSDEWLYSISFAASPKAKRDFFMLTKSINSLLMKDGYSLQKQDASNIIYSHNIKPLVTLSLVTKNGKSNVEIMVVQNERFFKNPKNRNNYFNPIQKSGFFNLSTTLGRASIKATPLLRVNQEQYTISYENLRKIKGTPTEQCATSNITMYLNRNSQNYWFASSCFTDAFYTIRGDQLVLTKHRNINGKLDATALAMQQKGVPLPKNGFDAQKKAIQLYAELVKGSAIVKPKKKITKNVKKKTPKKVAPKPEDTSFKYAVSFVDDLALVRYGNKQGFINADGKQVIPAIYDNANSFTEGLASVRKDNQWGFIDKTGAVKIPLEYEVTMSFTEGMAGAKKDGKWGFIDKTGKEIIPFQYEFIFPFSDGLAGVRKEGLWGFIDKSGKVIIPFQYDRAYSFSGGIASVGKNGKRGIINTKGEAVTPLQFESTYAPADGYLVAKLNGKYGMVNANGKTVIPFEYDGMSYFHDGLAQIKRGSLYGFVNRQGKEIIKPTYKKVGYPSEGLILVRKDNQWAYINTQGNLRFSIKYAGARDFKEGLARVYDNGKYGFIDKTGKEVIPVIYDYSNYDFKGGLIVVTQNGKVKVLKNPLKD